MGMARDFLRIYGCILGAMLVVGGVVLIGFLVFLALLSGLLILILTPIGVIIAAIGAGILHLILKEEEPNIYAPPPGAADVPATPPTSDIPAGTATIERLELPSVPVLLAIFLIGVGAGVLALSFGSLPAFILPFIVVSTFPPLIWISYVYGHDTLEPEPPRFVLIALTGGMLSVIPALFFNTLAEVGLVIGLLFMGFQPDNAALWVIIIVPVAVAPIVEEASKPLVLRNLKDEIDTELDGVLYGVTAGMGFALLENILYLAFGFASLIEVDYGFEDVTGTWAFTALARGLGSIGIHAVGAGLIGRAYARMLHGKGGMEDVGKAYLVAVLIHAGWNGASTLSLFGEDYILLFIIIIAIYAIGVIFFLNRIIKEAVDVDRRTVAPGTKTRRRAAAAETKRRAKLEEERAKWNAQWYLYQQYSYPPPGAGYPPAPPGHHPPPPGHHPPPPGHHPPPPPMGPQSPPPPVGPEPPPPGAQYPGGPYPPPPYGYPPPSSPYPPPPGVEPAESEPGPETRRRKKTGEKKKNFEREETGKGRKGTDEKDRKGEGRRKRRDDDRGGNDKRRRGKEGRNGIDDDSVSRGHSKQKRA
jgi:RsiW-degrading membrane proteinase PrsW (M82 family)